MRVEWLFYNVYVLLYVIEKIIYKEKKQDDVFIGNKTIDKQKCC